jgi:predicted Zn finger-like uncharacterized protein
MAAAACAAAYNRPSMSLITRCTACETLFRVVPDQLRVSEGWVRCGQCGEIFDGAGNLVEGELPSSLPAADPLRHLARSEGSGSDVIQGNDGPGSHSSPVQDNNPPLAPAPATEDGSEGPDIDARNGEAAAFVPVMESGFVDGTSAPETVASEAIPIARSPGPEGPGFDLASVEPQPSQMSPVPTAVQESAPEPAAVPDDTAQGPSFMRASAPPSRWQRAGVRASLAGLSFALLLVLAAQIARHERDRLAALAPAWRPALAQLCAWTRCSVEPPRQIESVVIDSSSFARVRGDVYQLAFSLRNAAPVDLAMPSVELAVTNSQDQPLSRRVLGPAELGASLPVIAAGMDWSARITLHVRTATPSDRIAGYRLLAFYP